MTWMIESLYVIKMEPHVWHCWIKNSSTLKALHWTQLWGMNIFKLTLPPCTQLASWILVVFAKWSNEVHHVYSCITFLNISFNRKVFFTDYGQIPKVERCDMDGQNRTKLVDSKIVFPHGITLDLVSRLVYWADAYLDYIEVVDYEGKNRHTIIQGLLVRSKYQDNFKLSFKKWPL